ncbi:class I adenylate-forming enzyme family protein [Amycolatopsis orientalis]|uniref:class I adenylate-forming enzyme family protein n=1 Tax=Amycolatopsis orientalis TaxID=31958 RepID=UPI000405908E|nr:class I adenylate-forming enzyme family protein [Amycolatopsis orientalis]
MPEEEHGVVAGPPLAVLGALPGGPRVEQLLERAVGAAPGRLAVASLTYAELDRASTRFALALRAMGIGPGDVVALPMALDRRFAIGFFGIAKAGAVSALVNPLLREEALAHVLALCGARTAFVTEGQHRVLAAVRDRLPALENVFLLGDGAVTGLSSMDDLIAAAPEAVLPEPSAGPDDLACLQFTSGTTGPAKAVRLSHRNLTVNAAQTAWCHRLSADSVLVNHLPTFHLMHLTIGVTVAARHVLCPGDDLLGAIATARAEGGTHFYSLPVRLARLAARPELPTLRVPSLQAILSGGSAMPPSATDTLSAAFGVPVVQGFGLAETAPSTHLGSLDRPKTGSSGPPVPGTFARVVDLDTGVPLEPGSNGEIQVRGPQLMLGYLGRDAAEDLPGGWLATGDVGHHDEDGYLFVVDRIKDVFKCDNWLVTPSEIEKVLLRHPGVADCVVLDLPHEFSGAVAHAVVVPSAEPATAGELATFVNTRLPYYEHLHGVHFADSVHRSPTGKVQRRDLREQLMAKTRS